jgi:ABC-type multidrug transport system permease subunit
MRNTVGQTRVAAAADISRLVRRAPLAKRLKAYTNPSDWLIWLSEELNSNDWDEFAQAYAVYIGFAVNILFYSLMTIEPALATGRTAMV